MWLDRKIFPESLLRRYIDDIGASGDDATVGFSLRRPSRSERAVDDPIREMEGMLVDEYGRYGKRLSCLVMYSPDFLYIADDKRTVRSQEIYITEELLDMRLVPFCRVFMNLFAVFSSLQQCNVSAAGAFFFS